MIAKASSALEPEITQHDISRDLLRTVPQPNDQSSVPHAVTRLAANP